MNDLKFARFRPARRLTMMIIVAVILPGFCAFQFTGCGKEDANKNMNYKKIEGRVEPLTYRTIPGPSLTLAIQKEDYLPYLEIKARLAPPFELPRRLPGRMLGIRVQAVKIQGNLDIYDQDHFFEKGVFAHVVYLNFNKEQGLWSGSRQVYLSDFKTTPLSRFTAVEGAMRLVLPIDPVSVEFNLNNYAGSHEVKGVRFEVEHLTSKKVVVLIFSRKENYLGMDARVNGEWILTLGRGESFTMTSEDQIVTERYRITVNFSQPVEAIKLYFCEGYTSIESDIRIQPDLPFTMNLD
ncbi:hypothetical protein ACFL03_04330 [Thermodesulfobacteriota bacterium]